jgi:HK97 gp10 family phage protein
VAVSGFELATKTGSGSEVTGIRELAKQIKALEDCALNLKAFEAVGAAASIVTAKAKANAARARWPHEVLANFFTFSRPSEDLRRQKKVSAIFGISKRGKSEPYRPGYVEWFAKDKGRVIGESLSTMFEFGTSKMGARPAFRPALQSERPRMLDTLKTKLQDVLKEAAK